MYMKEEKWKIKGRIQSVKMDWTDILIVNDKFLICQ